MRQTVFKLLLIVYCALLVLSSSSLMNNAFALSGTGVGIRKDGPEWARVDEIILYNITVYNLGDYWIRNATIIDIFPDGTSSIWRIPDIAPLNQSGNSYSISGILYTVKARDLFNEPIAYILNHAEVAGFSDVGGTYLIAQAETNFITFVESPLVGGYSVTIRPAVPSKLSDTCVAPHFATLSIIIAAFLEIKRKMARVKSLAPGA